MALGIVSGKSHRICLFSPPSAGFSYTEEILVFATGQRIVFSTDWELGSEVGNIWVLTHVPLISSVTEGKLFDISPFSFAKWDINGNQFLYGDC